VAKGRITPYHFFLRHAGGSYNPQTETKQQGRIRGAQQLAKAERWAESEGLVYRWEEDTDCGPDDFEFEEDKEHVRQDGARYCVLVRQCPECYAKCGTEAAYCKHDEVLTSLSGITESLNNRERDNYRRVVEAELALEAMPDDWEENPTECRQTACQHCGADIENLTNARGVFPRGQWRDRGNNRRCNGKNGRVHAPTTD
jgi:hypothetical protein